MMELASTVKALTVSQLNNRVRDHLEEFFGDVWLEGEVSQPTTSTAGHTYFKLKDAEAQIDAALFKGAGGAMRFRLEHGLQVLVRGRVTIYPKGGRYQIVVSHVQPKAVGALQLAFEQLKKKLEAEGLFSEERKRPLPPFPETVGLVTSLSGAAVRDILSVLRRRFDGLRILINPVAVQGEGAAAQIASAIADFNKHFPETDVLLVGRGGGSLEDLWAFNEEVVARAIAGSKIPVVSCVGHETDFTIADFVADLRAPTPSAAAELIVMEKEAALELVRNLGGRMVLAMQGTLRPLQDALSRLRRSPFLLQGARLFEQRQQRIDELAVRLAPALRGLLRGASERLAPMPGRLGNGVRQAVLNADKDLKSLLAQLDALSPLNVLSRGYAIAFKQPGDRVVRSPKDVAKGDKVRIKVEKGEFDAEVQ